MTEYLQHELEKRKQIIEMAAPFKYNRPGIYQIFINNTLVYIGKSQSMIDRIASHMLHIDTNEKSNKYIQLRRAREAGCQVRFDVLSYCKEDELDKYEGIYIRQYMPPLNYQIPKVDGNGWTIQKRAKTITYEQILGKE